MRTVAAVVVATALVGRIGIATAEAPAAPALSWLRVAGAERCIAGPELAERVEAHLGRPVLVALPQAQLAVEGSVAAESQGYRVYLRLADREGATRGERTLAIETQDCRALDEWIVFLIALMLDPDAPLLPPRLPDGLSPDTRQALSDLFGNEPTVPPLELAEPAASTPADTAAARASPTPARTRELSVAAAEDEGAGSSSWTVGARLEGLAAIGLLPGPGTGGRVSLVATLSDALRFDVGGAVFLDNAIENESASFSLVQGELAACPALFTVGSALVLWSCARATAGALIARADVVGARDTERFVLQIGGGPELAWSMGTRTSLHLGLTALVPLVRDRYFLSGPRGRDMAFRMSPVVGLANVALHVRLF